MFSDYKERHRIGWDSFLITLASVNLIKRLHYLIQLLAYRESLFPMTSNQNFCNGIIRCCVILERRDYSIHFINITLGKACATTLSTTAKHVIPVNLENEE
mmetsp:Transcript_119887/g.346397  ORF Transcript_119887/g.346397 Transcript_119887/m.346397 type:complete len:101 (-) Transcript_119887:6132-6434(-)